LRFSQKGAKELKHGKQNLRFTKNTHDHHISNDLVLRRRLQRCVFLQEKCVQMVSHGFEIRPSRTYRCPSSCELDACEFLQFDKFRNKVDLDRCFIFSFVLMKSNLKRDNKFAKKSPHPYLEELENIWMEQVESSIYYLACIVLRFFYEICYQAIRIFCCYSVVLWIINLSESHYSET
jgi:hypothetical protein